MNKKELKELKKDNRVLYALMKDDVIDRFINKGENSCVKGPGDITGASYAFDLYDFANGTYRYEYQI